MDKEQLENLVAARLSLEEIMDILGWDVPDIVAALMADIWEQREAFEEALE